MTTLSEGCSCPVCGNRFSATEIQRHTNECLDKTLEQLEEKESLESLDDDWTILSSTPKSQFPLPKPKRHTPIVDMFSSFTKTLLGPTPDPDHHRHHSTTPGSCDDFVELVEISTSAVPDTANSLIHLNFQKYISSFLNYNATQDSLHLLWNSVKLDGIPDELRGPVWKILCGYHGFVAENPSFFQDCYNGVFGETWPESLYTVPTFGGKLSPESHCLSSRGFLAVQRILCVLASRKASIDYCPMIPELVSILVSFMSEEEAFVVAYLIICTTQQYRFYGAITKKFSVKQLISFSSLVELKHYRLKHHMDFLHVDFNDCEWFDRLFVTLLPYSTVLQIFDSFLVEGIILLYRIGLAFLEFAKPQLLHASSSAEFINILQNLACQSWNCNKLIERGFKFYIPTSVLSELDLRSEEILKAKNIDVAAEHQIYYRPKFKPSSLISIEQFEIIYSWIPLPTKLQDPVLLYDSSVDGFNLNTLIQRSYSHRPTLLIVKDSNQFVFGAYVTAEWKFQPNPFGDNKMFLYTIHPSPEVFHALPESNEHFIKLTQVTGFKIGDGSEGPGLHIDNELWKGYTNHSSTYNNGILASGQEFAVMAMELWGFY